MPTRERMMLFGADQASEAELLNLILGRDAAVRRALDLVRTTGGLLGLERMGLRALSRLPGVGPDGAAAIGAAIELGRRMGRLSLRYARSTTGPKDIAEYLRCAIGPAASERFMEPRRDCAAWCWPRPARRVRECSSYDFDLGT